MLFRLTLFIALALSTTFTAAAERPNVVWLVSEDSSKHFFKLFDEHGAPTPRIEQFAAHGLTFKHAFSNSPVCSVARTTLITGCYAPRIGTQFHRKLKAVPMPDGLKMFPAYLRDAGYYTTNNSKKDYNAIEGKGVWDESSRKATWRNRKENQPFFHMQSFGASHESSLHFSAAQMKNQKTTTDPKTVLIPPMHPDTPTFRYTYARYHDRIMEIDRQIGNVVDQLEKDGLLEETFIFFFGDHGGVLPGSKGYLYETGLHVPLVVRVPEKFKHLVDAKRGETVNGFVSFIDFGPTVLHLAGVDVPAAVDGKPFLGKGVAMDEVNARDEAFGYADRFDEKYDLVRTLRKGNLKYMRSFEPFNFDGLQNNYRYRMLAYQEWRDLYHAGTLNAVQRQFFEPRQPEALYDLANDPYETKNVVNHSQYGERLAEMRNRLRERMKGMPDLSMYPESELVERAFDNPVAFGQKHKAEIATLIDIADLSLPWFDKATQNDLAAALKSPNPWHRYWALIACSSHGIAAFVDEAKQIAANDTEPLVRVRAAEFLALIGEAEPQPVIMKALAETTSGVEAGIILNTIVMLRDGKPGYKFDISAADINPAARNTDTVKRRLQYLTGK